LKHSSRTTGVPSKLHAPPLQQLPFTALSLRAKPFLGFQVLLLELHIALEIYVVPFSNAKVVGSFRMARLNMFRRKVLLKISPASRGSKFFGSLAVHGMENCTCVNSESIVKETNLKTICLTIQKTVQL
jgi:hypothetical protein